MSEAVIRIHLPARRLVRAYRLGCVQQYPRLRNWAGTSSPKRFPKCGPPPPVSMERKSPPDEIVVMGAGHAAGLHLPENAARQWRSSRGGCPPAVSARLVDASALPA